MVAVEALKLGAQEYLEKDSHELRTPLNPILGMSEGLQAEVFGQLNDRQIQGSSSSPAFIQFSVQDTGIGIAPENLKHLFQFFTQIDDRLNRNYEGIGIGLSLVRHLVELHRGNITVESQLGRGSCFTVSLPL